MPLGSLFEGDKGPEPKTCRAHCFQSRHSISHCITSQEKGSVLSELCQSLGTRASNGAKDALSILHPSWSKPILAIEQKGRGITVLASPQAPSPSERVNPAFKSRLPPASSPPDVARHHSLMRLTCIFNVVIFWLWQLYRHRDYKSHFNAMSCQ